MKKRIVLGGLLLLLLGTAAGDTLIYAQGEAKLARNTLNPYPSAARQISPDQVTPQLLALWKASAVSTDYLMPKAPL